ncbi:MAG: hypothetical protein ACT4PO_02120 [Actinomycetota bacterium]
MRRVIPSLAVGVAFLVTACPGGESDRAPVPESSVQACRVDVTPPPEFRLQNTIRRSESDHVGIRRSFVDAAGRVLHFFSGISGEFGEGMSVAGSLTVAGGEEARLLGVGQDWVLVWSSSGPCAAQAVIGNGFARGEFLQVLEASGVLAAG